MSALALAGSVAKPATDQAVKDAYAGLRQLVIRRFGPKQPLLESSIDQHAQDPETWKAPVQKLLEQAGAEQDQEVRTAAIDFLKLAEAHQPGVTGGVVQTINAEQIGNVGTNYGTIDMRRTH
jgi:hypothetical protein